MRMGIRALWRSKPARAPRGAAAASEPPAADEEQPIGPDRDPEGQRPPDEPPDPGSPVVVPRWIQLVVLPIGLLGLWALARAAGPVLLILIAASTIALILNPLVKRL